MKGGLTTPTNKLELCVHNMPDIPGTYSLEHTMFHFHGNLIYDELPTLVWCGNMHIELLHSMKHTEEDIKFLNDKGLSIYLTEPICSYSADENPEYLDTHGTNLNFGFYSEFYQTSNTSSYRAYELDSILRYIKNNKLTNVKVYSGEYKINEVYTYYSKYMKLICYDLYLLSVSSMRSLVRQQKRSNNCRL